MVAELEIRDSPKFLAGTLADLEVTVYRDGNLVDPASAGTVTVTDADGNVLSTGAASIVGSSSGLLRYTPTAAAMANVNQLTITWAGVVLGSDPAITLTTYGEVVGDMLFTEAQARAFGDQTLANTTKFSDGDIRRGHDLILDAFETILGYPLGRRYYRDVLSGDGSAVLMVPRSYPTTVRAISTRGYGGTTWTAFTESELAAVFAQPWGALSWESGYFPSGTQNLRVSYEAGNPIHPEIRRAALRLLRYQLVPTDLPDRALFMNNELGQIRLAVADDKNHWFGLPDVDSVLNRHRLVGIA